MRRTHDRSHCSGDASSTSSIGRAKASPTIATPKTRSLAITSTHSRASKERPSRSTTLPATRSPAMPIVIPVPCMSGLAGIERDTGTCVVAARRAPPHVIEIHFDGIDRRSRVRMCVEIGVAPHHALRHAGGAARVEEDEVVATATPRRAGARVVAAAAACSYGTAQSGTASVPSSTCSQTLTAGTAERTSATRSVNEPWKTTATASESFQRYASSSGAVAVVGVDGREADLGGGEERSRGTRAR